MTSTLVPIGSTSDDRNQAQSHFAMRLTWRMAQRAGLCDKVTFIRGTTAAGEMIHENMPTGRPQSNWVMGSATLHEITTPYNTAATEQMAAALSKHADPVLDRIDAEEESAQALIESARTDPGSYRFEETGEVFNDREALEQYTSDRQRVTVDQAAGLMHHNPCPHWLKAAGEVSPFGEALGILAILQYWLNADLIRPWVNWLTWTFTVVVVLVVCVVQAWLAKHAGEAHNAARQLDAENNPHASEPHKVKRNRLLVCTAAVAAVISATMVIRALESITQPSTEQLLLLAGLSAIAGAGMPLLSFAAKAFDGSQYSRRAASLFSQGSAAAQTQQADLESAREILRSATALDETVTTSTLPRIVEDARQQVYGAVAPWTLAHVQVGAQVKGLFTEESG